MEDGRLDNAVQRIGTAIDRLEAALSAPAPQPSLALEQANPNEQNLVSRHEAMQAEVRDTLAALDDLISGLEK